MLHSEMRNIAGYLGGDRRKTKTIERNISAYLERDEGSKVEKMVRMVEIAFQ